MRSDYSDASLEELRLILKKYLKIQAEYGEEKRPEIEEVINRVRELIVRKEVD